MADALPGRLLQGECGKSRERWAQQGDERMRRKLEERWFVPWTLGRLVGLIVLLRL